MLMLAPCLAEVRWAKCVRVIVCCAILSSCQSCAWFTCAAAGSPLQFFVLLAEIPTPVMQDRQIRLVPPKGREGAHLNSGRPITEPSPGIPATQCFRCAEGPPSQAAWPLLR